MCGIFGIKRLEDDAGRLASPILQAQIDLGLNSIEYRGNDAAGVALISLSGDIHVFKNHEAAWNLTASKAYRDFMAEHLTEEIICALAHTRKATKGNPFHNKNNHPLIKDAGTVIHNGMLSNDDQLFRDLKLDRGAETDSDIIRAILDAGNGVSRTTLNEMNRISGSVASAMCHPEDPTKLLLLRSGNPLVCADDGEKFYFASDKRTIYRAARPWIERHGFPMQLQAPNIAFVTMPNDTGWIIGAKGLEWHDKFVSTGTRYRYNSYSEVYSPHGRDGRRAYQKSQAEAAIEPNPPAKDPPAQVISTTDYGKIDYVHCPNKQCGHLLALSEDQKKIPLIRLRCPKCKSNLNGAYQTVRLLSKEPEPPQVQVH